MTLVPNETEQALNRQHDVYAAAREEYQKKIAELQAEIERLRAALEVTSSDCKEAFEDNERLRVVLEEVAEYEIEDGCPCSACQYSALARAALEGKL